MAKARALLAQGLSQREVATRLGVARGTLQKALAEKGLSKQPPECAVSLDSGEGAGVVI